VAEVGTKGSRGAINSNSGAVLFAFSNLVVAPLALDPRILSR
jgi:hypothetical protein